MCTVGAELAQVGRRRVSSGRDGEEEAAERDRVAHGNPDEHMHVLAGIQWRWRVVSFVHHRAEIARRWDGEEGFVADPRGQPVPQLIPAHGPNGVVEGGLPVARDVRVRM